MTTGRLDTHAQAQAPDDEVSAEEECRTLLDLEDGDHESTVSPRRRVPGTGRLGSQPF